MAPSVLACLFFIFFLPACFSNSCTPTLPCDPSIQIKPPFIFQSDITMGLNCEGYLTILCDNDKPFLVLVPNPLPLESISYENNTITVQDPYLSSCLKKSGCHNLYFNFSSPIKLYLGMYDLLNSSFSSVRCHPPDHIQLSLPFGKDYSLSYSSSLGQYHKPMLNCLRPEYNSLEPSFESILSFEKGSSQLTLIAVSYSSDLVARPGCFANWIEVLDREDGKGKKIKQATRVTILIGSMAFLGICLILYLKLRSSKNSAECISWSKERPEGNIEMFLEKNGSFAPKRYKYTEVKKITSLFQHRIGKGGFGTVYRGILQDGRLVAVKILHNFSCGREELLNEVLSIGRTSHVNVVSLLGFCIEGSKHALIYEYMPNGSLDNYIYSENPKAVLGWAKLYEIAIGIARGLEYLHRGCNTRIVHFDIKPHNILLDEDFNPKIADFGLAKLCPPKESIISMAGMRGTIGYIAPEVFSRSFGVVSTKSDVYSYGAMVLEMVGGRRNAKPSAENSSQEYFPHWLYDCLVEGSPIQLQACDVLSMEIEEIAKKIGMVGLWCTQTIPANRPSMNRVVEMLERSSDQLEMPPKPYFCSPSHSTILSDTSHTLKSVLNSESDSDCLIGVNAL
ncbi:PR5-like receptor kinase isoform X2 [Carex rostrata]